MFGCVVRRKGDRKDYAQRLDMVKDLIRETQRDDWALAMGLIKSDEVATVLGGPNFADETKGSSIPGDDSSIGTTNLDP